MDFLLRILLEIRKFKRNKSAQINDTTEKQPKDELLKFNHEIIPTLKYEKSIILENFVNYVNLMKDDASDFKKVYLINNSRQNIHIGCNTVMKNIQACCEKINHKIIYFDRHFNHVFNDVKDILPYKNIINCSDVILFNGEGTLHHSRGFSMFYKCQIAKDLGKKNVLFNTVWQENKDMKKYLKLFDIITTRESLSAHEIEKVTSKKVMVVPDMVFYSDKLQSKKRKKKIIFTDSVDINITDKLYKISEKLNYDFYFLTDVLHSKYQNQKYLTEEIIAGLSKDSLIITGRFHVVAFAIKYGIPFIAIPSNTHKTEGLLKDADLQEYLISDLENIEYKIKEFLNKNHEEYYRKALTYSNNAKVKINDLFEQIKHLTD